MVEEKEESHLRSVENKMNKAQNMLKPADSEEEPEKRRGWFQSRKERKAERGHMINSSTLLYFSRESLDNATSNDLIFSYQIGSYFTSFIDVHFCISFPVSSLFISIQISQFFFLRNKWGRYLGKGIFVLFSAHGFKTVVHNLSNHKRHGQVESKEWLWCACFCFCAVFFVSTLTISHPVSLIALQNLNKILQLLNLEI